MKNKSGIYEILNTVDGKRYIGSAVNIAARWRGHKSKLRNGDHHGPKLQRAWNKHGSETFQFRVLLLCSRDNLILYEQLSMAALRPEYNTCQVAGSTLGVKQTIETRQKLSLVLRGNTYAKGSKRTIEQRAQMSLSHMGNQNTLGVYPSDETRAKLSIARMGNKNALGYKHSDETRRKVSAGLVGKKRRPFSEEHRRKIALARMGTTASLATREKLSAAHKGRKRTPRTPEQRALISAALFAYNARRRAAKQAQHPPALQ